MKKFILPMLMAAFCLPAQASLVINYIPLSNQPAYDAETGEKINATHVDTLEPHIERTATVEAVTFDTDNRDNLHLHVRTDSRLGIVILDEDNLTTEVAHYVIGHEYEEGGKELKDQLVALIESPEENHIIVNYDMYSFSRNVIYVEGTLDANIPNYSAKSRMQKAVDTVVN